MRIGLTFLAFVALAAAQSHPSWWTYASPGATALVGIEWQSVRSSPFADPIEAELWGDLGFPDLPCLHNAREIVISSPQLLALVRGSFSPAAMNAQAAKEGLKAMTYRGVDMWFAGKKGALSVARLNDQLALVGLPETLQEAVDRSMNDARNYSPLLARAARFAQTDLWVVASQLPDELASRFVPLDTEAQRFEGSVLLRNGLELNAALSAGSEQQANASAMKLRQEIPGFPEIARGLQVTVEEDSITLALAATRAQVIAALSGPAPDLIVAPPIETIRIETPTHVEQVAVEILSAPNPIEKPVGKPVEKEPEKVTETTAKPQVIRIIGLDEGPREIVLPPVKPDRPNN